MRSQEKLPDEPRVTIQVARPAAQRCEQLPQFVKGSPSAEAGVESITFRQPPASVEDREAAYRGVFDGQQEHGQDHNLLP